MGVSRPIGEAEVPEPLSQYQCCERMQWTPVADLGEAAGFDFDLGRCAACGISIMAVFYVSSTTYNCISDEQAQRFLSLRDDAPALKKALRKWVD